MIDFDALVNGAVSATFGEPVLFEPLGRASFMGVGVYQEPFLEQMPMGDFAPGNIGNTKPSLGVRLSQFPAGITYGDGPEQSDVLTVIRTGGRFFVNEVRKDGQGWAKLLLGDASIVL